MTTIERALNSIGKRCFIRYYNDFRRCSDKKALARKLLTENPGARSQQAQMTRVNYAAWIFQNELEREALRIVIQSNMDDATIQIARNLLIDAERVNK